MEEPQRGPLEQELHEMLTQGILGTPWILDRTTGRSKPTDPVGLKEMVDMLTQVVVTQRRAILRLAQEIDDLRSAND